jgi:16S rRNA (guanine527-N7)-methyltransferase
VRVKEAQGISYRQLLEDFYRAAGLDHFERDIEALLRHIAEIELFNAAFGLVNARGEELVIKHIIDSLLPCPYLGFEAGMEVADLGSGAGLPGLPLAIHFPDVRFSLVERSGKRVGFLRNAVLATGVRNAEVVEKGFEDLPPRGFDALVFRAFRPLEPPMYKSMRSVLKPGGRIYAWKGKEAKVAEECAALDLGPGGYESISLRLPNREGEERHLVVIPPRGAGSSPNPSC